MLMLQRGDKKLTITLHTFTRCISGKKVTEKAQQYPRYCISEGGGPLIPGEEGPKETGEVMSNSLP